MSIHSVLGTAASPGWALLTLDSFSIDSAYDDYDWGSQADPYLYNLRMCDSGAGLDGWRARA